MASFTDYLSKGWGYVSDAYDTVSNYASTAYDAASSYIDTAVGFLDAAGDNPIVQGIAGFASKSLIDPKTGAPRASGVKGERMSSVSPSAGSAAYKASAVDMGYTAKVQNAIRAAQNARVGSKIDTTIGYISGKPAKGPLLKLDSNAGKIAVAPRAK